MRTVHHTSACSTADQNHACTHAQALLQTALDMQQQGDIPVTKWVMAGHSMVRRLPLALHARRSSVWGLQLTSPCWLAGRPQQGGRVASAMAHAHPESAPACVFFSYPLHPPGRTDQLRDDPLTALQVPLLFVRGTKDSFSEEAQFQQILKRLASPKVQVSCCMWPVGVDTAAPGLLDVTGLLSGVPRCMNWREGTTP